MIVVIKHKFRNHIWQQLREFCDEHNYWRVSGLDLETKTVVVHPEKGARVFHVRLNGSLRLYPHDFETASRFQEGLASVGETDPGCHTHHIRLDGQPAYQNRFESVGPFFEGLANVRNESGEFHVLFDGQPAYERRFEKVGHFRFGLAQAKDGGGWYHITPGGTAAYSPRFLKSYPFGTNGTALVEYWDEKTKTKRRGFINQSGELV